MGLSKNKPINSLSADWYTDDKFLKKEIEVFTYDGTEISLKGAGGPTCLTRPFLRTSL